MDGPYVHKSVNNEKSDFLIRNKSLLKHSYFKWNVNKVKWDFVLWCLLITTSIGLYTHSN